jgi:hypothetical protein
MNDLKHKLLTEKRRQYAYYFLNRRRLFKILSKSSSVEKKQLQFPKNIAILFIGTGKYLNYFPEYYREISRLFLPGIRKEFFVFTDTTIDFIKGKRDVHTVLIHQEKEPMLMMVKNFDFVSKAIEKLKDYDYVVKIDADLKPAVEIRAKDFFFHNKPLFTVRHPNFLSLRGNFERDEKSCAAVSKKDDLSVYVQACFYGGKTKEFISMIRNIRENVKKDLEKGVVAKVADESHLNRYFINHKDLFYVYDPSWSYPTKRPIPKPFVKRLIHGK